MDDPGLRLTAYSHGAGCACKLGPLELAAVLKPLLPTVHPDLLVGIQTGDDAAVWRRPDGRSIVATVDFFAPVIDDPFTFGAIAATNAASDVFAMGAEPLFALNIVAWPRDRLPLSVLAEVCAGGASAAVDGGWMVAGGHSVDGPEPMYGQVVIGELAAGVDPLTNAGAQVGDVLVLTKSLGTGVVATAHKRLPPEAIAPGGPIHEPYTVAVASMRQLNAAAARDARTAGAHAMTDVTGFGLTGHLHKMLVASGVAARVDLPELPVIHGVRSLIIDGMVPGGTTRNLDFVGDHLVGGSEHDRALVADPQTSGGLLIACPLEHATHIHDGVVIGQVVDGPAGQIELVEEEAG
jgi:selenide,water dikinase